MVDIIIFFIIAVFLFLKLKSIVGKEDDSSVDLAKQTKIHKSLKNITNSAKDLNTEIKKDLKEQAKLDIEEKVKENIKLLKPEFEPQYRMISPTFPAGFFDVKNFLDGVEALLVELINARSKKDLKLIESELSTNLRLSLESLIEKEKSTNSNQLMELFKVESIEIEDIKAKNNGSAEFRVKILSKQIRYTKEGEDVVQGSIELPSNFIDYFTIQRVIKNKSYSWVLDKIE